MVVVEVEVVGGGDWVTVGGSGGIASRAWGATNTGRGVLGGMARRTRSILRLRVPVNNMR